MVRPSRRLRHRSRAPQQLDLLSFAICHLELFTVRPVLEDDLAAAPVGKVTIQHSDRLSQTFDWDNNLDSRFRSGRLLCSTANQRESQEQSKLHRSTVPMASLRQKQHSPLLTESHRDHRHAR